MWKPYDRCSVCKSMSVATKDELLSECPRCGKWYTIKRVQAKKIHNGKWYNPLSWFKYRWLIKKNPESN